MPENSEDLALRARRLVLRMVYEAKASHTGGALSMTDILAVLYSGILHIDPSDPGNAERDRFLLSKGHACAGLYAVLGLRGFFPVGELKTYACDGSRYLSHTSHLIPGVEVSAGSLGHALPIAAGLAVAAKRKGMRWKTYCLISDGELNEGSNWETILFAPQHKLDNLVLIVDYNKIQSLGNVKDIIELEPLKAKFDAFRWETYEIDGHNHREVYDALIKCGGNNNGAPKVIIAHTIKGKGVDFMENKLLWHYKSPDAEEFKAAIDGLT